MSEQEFKPGSFVWVQSRNESRPVVGRVIATQGSEYRVAWCSENGGAVEMHFGPDEMEKHALVYLIGLVAAAYVAGWLAERRSWDRRMPTAALLALVGVAVLYIPGRIWVEALALFLREYSSQTDVLPTVPMRVITIIIMAVALPRAWAWVEGRQRASHGAGPAADDEDLQSVDPTPPPSGSPSTTPGS
jgi:hypothetical protein